MRPEMASMSGSEPELCLWVLKEPGLVSAQSDTFGSTETCRSGLFRNTLGHIEQSGRHIDEPVDTDQRGLFPAVRSRFRSPMPVFLCVCWWSFLLWRQLHPPADRGGICADVAPPALSNLQPGGASVFGCGEQRLPAAGAHLRPRAGKTPTPMTFTG